MLSKRINTQTLFKKPANGKLKFPQLFSTALHPMINIHDGREIILQHCEVTSKLPVKLN